MKKFGVIGKTLSHSLSPQIHENFFEFYNVIGEYKKYEISDLSEFILFAKQNLDGFNVTFPFKEQILDYLDEISPLAKEIGSVNCVKVDGDKLVGYNTDFEGFKYYFDHFVNKDSISNALVFGYGGASKAIISVLKHLNVDFVVANRTLEKVPFDNKLSIEDANAQINHFDLVINSTSVGYNFDSIVSNCAYNENAKLIDINYEPYFTKFLKDGINLGLGVKNGLDMLIVQALQSFYIWNDLSGDFNLDLIFDIKVKIMKIKVVIDGFMGSGKSTLANVFDDYVDLDEFIQSQENMKISEIFEAFGEDHFRKLEQKYLPLITSKVICLGGGTSFYCDVNELIGEHVHVLIDAPLEQIKYRLSSDTSRPLKSDLDQLYKKRRENYCKLSDVVIKNDSDVRTMIVRLKEKL